MLLVVEVVSPSSLTSDRIAKPALYAAAQIRHCWRIETADSGGPMVITYRLDGNIYAEEGTVAADGTVELDEPFCVTLIPSGLSRWRRCRTGRPQSATGPGATVSHMEVGIRELRNRTAEVIAAVQSGQRVTLNVNGSPVADIVPHARRTPWLSGTVLRAELQERAADHDLTADLDALAGHTLDEL